jgi:hypothetical protein
MWISFVDTHLQAFCSLNLEDYVGAHLPGMLHKISRMRCNKRKGTGRVKITIVVLALALGAAFLNAQLTRQDWLRADEQTVRLQPSAFPNLPSAVRDELEHRGCAIPQPFGVNQPRNVVSGSFVAVGQTDWAVLCSRNKRSAILVFESARTGKVDEFADEPDLQYLQVVTRDNKIGYSRVLTSVSDQSFRKRIGVRASKLRTIDHNGIEDAFMEKASTLWYRSGAKWIKLSAGD